MTGLGAVLIASQTLVPQPIAIRAVPSPRLCFACEELASIDILLNILLFIPFGIGLRLSGCSRKSGVATAAVLSGVTELLQVSVVTGRDSSARDLLTNTLGALLGVMLADGWKRLAFPSDADARRLLSLSAACWLLLSVGEAALLGRAFPPTIWYGQWAPDGVFPATFSGRVLAVRMDSLDLFRGEAAELRPCASRAAPGSLDADRGSRDRRADPGLQLGVQHLRRRAARDARRRAARNRSVRPISHSRCEDGPPVALDRPSRRFRTPTRRAYPDLDVVRPGRDLFDNGRFHEDRLPGGVRYALLGSESPVAVRCPNRSARAPVVRALDGGSAVPHGLLDGAEDRHVQGRGVRGLLLFLGMGLTPLLFQLPPARLEEWTAGAAGLVTGWWLGRAGRR